MTVEVTAIVGERSTVAFIFFDRGAFEPIFPARGAFALIFPAAHFSTAERTATHKAPRPASNVVSLSVRRCESQWRDNRFH